MAGISIGVASETRAFKQGIETGVIKPIEEAVDALEDLGKSRGPDKLTDGLRDAQKATDRLGDETKDTARAIEQEYRDSYRKLKDSADDGYGRVKESARSAKEEAVQNFAETASSFDGSMSGIADGIQGTFGGLATALPLPLGIAAGAIGIIGGTMAQQWADNTEEMTKAAGEWADAYIEAGGRILTSSQIVGKVQAISTNPEQYKQAEDNARNWGTSVSLAMLAMAGDANALAEAQGSLNAKTDEYTELTQTSAVRTGDGITQLKNQRNELNAGQTALDGITGAMAKGAQQADAYSESLRLTAEHTAGATTVIDGFGDKITTLPDGKQIYIDAETGKATTDTEAIANKVYGIQDKTVNIAVNADTSGAERDVNNFLAAVTRKSASVGVGTVLKPGTVVQ